jgi:peptidoglycan/LPS O-acetylase OafA/YrhL
MTAPQPRPRVVTAAFWCWVAAAFLLMLGGIISASLNLPLFYRGAGVTSVLAGGGIAFLAGRARTGDTRFRRAAVGLSFAVVVLAAFAALLRIINLFTLLAVLPLIAATVLITRPAAASTDEEPQ